MYVGRVMRSEGQWRDGEPRRRYGGDALVCDRGSRAGWRGRRAPPHPLADAAAPPNADPARAEAQAWAREYSARTGAPTTIDVLLLDERGDVLAAAPDGFYYDPRYPDRDPYEKYGY